MTPAQFRKELIELTAECDLDPLRFVRTMFPWGKAGTDLADATGPREWQADVLGDLGDRLRAGYAPGAALMPVLKAVASGHGVGKSALVSWIIAWAMATCPDTKVVVTANTEPQLRTKTWPEVAKWFRLLLCQRLGSPWFQVMGMSIASTEPGHDKTWRADAITWSETNLEAFAGLHNKGRRIVLVFDEASGIADRVWEVAEGALTDEDTEILWCAFGNPTQPAGRFFEAVEGRQRHRWRSKQIDSRTVPGTNKALFAEWEAAYGEDSDFMRVRVRGMFPRAGSRQFIGPDLVRQAGERDIVTSLDDPFVIGVDVARFGDDQSVILFRKGRDARTVPPIRLRGVDTQDLASRVMIQALKYRADAVFVDGVGVGGGVVDRLRALRCPNLFDVQAGGKPRQGQVDGIRYANKRAEMWGDMREWLRTGAIDPADREMASDLAGPEYTFTASGDLLLERKEDMKRRGLASPDLADALALTFAEPVQPSALSGGKQVLPQARRSYDPHAGL